MLTYVFTFHDDGKDKFRDTTTETITLETEDGSIENLADLFGRWLLAISFSPDTVATVLVDYETSETQAEAELARKEIEHLHDRIAELEALVAEHTDIPYGMED